ncbi:MAG TPA: F0F1 ATP synthase subunit A [Solirubrobacteraceae bacterium]|nr:F0F1 ATP synthase subunit A [Solirubrobacteraceae bacterium]
MTKTQKILFACFGVYIGVFVLLLLIYGFTQHKNNTFQIQNEFKLVNWVSLGVFSINRAVLYLFISAVLTVFTMVWIAGRMQARPNKIQTAVEVIFSLMRDNITRGNMSDSMAARWFPFLGTLFLFIWFCNLVGYLPLPTNTEEKFNLFGAHIPSFALYAATANISVPLVLALVVFIAFVTVGIRTQGAVGYLKSLIPAGVHGPMLLLIFPIEVISTLMRLLSLTIRLWANIFAGHIIILFMAGGLAVILGLQALGWFALPAGIIIYLFELGLVATLQAFIFATLAAIYLGGAVTHH